MSRYSGKPPIAVAPLNPSKSPSAKTPAPHPHAHRRLNPPASPSAPRLGQRNTRRSRGHALALPFMTPPPNEHARSCRLSSSGSRLELFTTKITKNTKSTNINLVPFVPLWLILPHFRNFQFAFFNLHFAISAYPRASVVNSSQTTLLFLAAQCANVHHAKCACLKRQMRQ